MTDLIEKPIAQQQKAQTDAWAVTERVLLSLQTRIAANLCRFCASGQSHHSDMDSNFFHAVEEGMFLCRASAVWATPLVEVGEEQPR